MRKEPKERWVDIAVWSAVGVLALLRFVHLGYGDLKDWDECLYAWRAKVICLLGSWRDQSDLAWGGFYSAAFPPLQVWVTAILFKLFGFNEFCARFWSALAGAGSIVVLFLMGRRMGRDRWAGFFAALFLAAVWYFTMYSRRAQFDVPYTFFITASLWGYLGYLDKVRLVGRRRFETEPGAWGWLVFSGLALGLGLMTKIALALTASIVAGALALYGWLRGRHPFGRIVAEQVVINGVALVINLPWHLAMTLSPQSRDFWAYYVGYHLLGRSATVLDAHAGPWYFYFPRLWDLLPAPVLALTLVALPWFLVEIAASFRRGGEMKETETADRRPLDYPDLVRMLPLIWLGFELLLFSKASTKRETYTIPMYPPIALMAGLFLAERLRDTRRMKLLAATLFSITTLCILSRMKTFGHRLEEAFANFDQIGLYGDVLGELGLLVGGVALGVAVLYFVLKRRPNAFRLLALATIVGAAVIFSLRQVRKVLDPEKGMRTFGWRQIRPYIDAMDYHYLVFAGSYFHPAARYYLNGLNLDWHPLIVFVPLRQYDETRLALYASSSDSRVVVMKSWVRDNWTPEQRARLLDRLELLAEGDDLAIYRPKAR